MEATPYPNTLLKIERCLSANIISRNNSNENPPIVITCGDPAGVGPEVAVSAWKALREKIPLCILIDPDFLPKNINI